MIPKVPSRRNSNVTVAATPGPGRHAKSVGVKEFSLEDSYLHVSYAENGRIFDRPRPASPDGRQIAAGDVAELFADIEKARARWRRTRRASSARGSRSVNGGWSGAGLRSGSRHGTGGTGWRAAAPANRSPISRLATLAVDQHHVADRIRHDLPPRVRELTRPTPGKHAAEAP
jgi:hypothetical protein